MITDVFLDQKRVNVCENTVKTAPHDRFILEEIEILNAASSQYLVNDINRRSDPVYRLIPLVSDFNSNGQQPRLDDRRDI